MAKHSHGYSLIEVLVSIAILLTAIVGPLTIASTGLKNAQFAREQNTAFFLAQEALEAVVFLRERAGLQHIANSSVNSWSWYTSLPAGCRSGQDCDIDVASMTTAVCSSINSCQLYLHSAGSVRYNHSASGGTQTPYVRSLRFTSIDAHTVKVRAVVTWSTNAFTTDKSVELEMYLYDIYGN